MSLDTTLLSKAKEVLLQAQDILIVTHERPTHDSIGSATALALALQSLGKRVTVACPDPITVELSNYVGVDKVISDVAGKNFIISLDYIEGSIEKVSYNIEGNKFNLVIEPRAGYDSFSQDKVHFTQEGAAADVVVTIDTIHLGGLKKLYDGDKGLYAGKPMVNIDRHPNNAQYGTVNVVDPSAPSTAEIVAELIEVLGVQLNADMATNLFNAMLVASNNFMHASVSEKTFDFAAKFMKSGGRRFTVRPNEANEERPVQESPVVQEAQTKNDMQVQGQDKPQKAGEAPADWLKPKIFKSSNLL